METEIMTKIAVENPITRKTLYEIEDTSEAAIKAVYERARAVQPKIASMSIEQRIEEVLKVNYYVLEHREELMTRIIEETGKSRFDALSTEIFEICDVIDYFKKAAPKILKDQKVHTPIVLMGKKSKIVIEPMGVILIIAPWNYPLYQGLVPSLLAFLAGNAIVHKPSEVTPLKDVFESILDGSGFMKDAIQIVRGGKETGKRLINEVPDKIHFTGSVASGKKIMEQAAAHLIPVDLELGGKDPSIVFDDVNLDKTVNGVLWGAMTSCGQSCTSIERCYVQEGIYDQFVEMLVDKAKKLRPSHPDRDYANPADCDVGSMTVDFQVQIIEKHIQDAVSKGAKVLVGGKREPNSLHFPPTVLVDVDHTMDVVMEESFGPLLPVMKFKTEAEAVKMANDSPYGLSASVWSKDMDRAERVAKAIKTGNVSINNHMLTEGNPALPFGGIKHSGFGRYKGDFGITTFSNIKSIIKSGQDKVIEPHWYPQTETKYKLMNDLMTALFGRSKNWIKFATVGLKLDSIGTKEQIK